MNDSQQQWWRNGAVYQIYLRSFADGDGDGIGDFTGLLSKLSYLHQLGINAVWITPFYPSPLADGGYDVADYCAIDPRLGTIQQFDKFVDQAHQLGIHVMVDIVPNHTSSQHPWFQRALEDGPESSAARLYIFHRGKGENHDEPPTNWQSNFGGSAWQSIGNGWFYLHLFAKEQPDLNWSNPQVRQEFLSILQFWCEHGVDGFRVDVSHGLVKDLSEPLRDRRDPYVFAPEADDGSDPTWDRDEVHTIYRQWRKLFNSYSPVKYAVGESWTPFTPRVFQYAHPDELGAVFDFSLEKADWDRDEYRTCIERTAQYAYEAGSVPTWVLGNHDVPRIASRLALPKGTNVEKWVTSNNTDPHIDPRIGRARARAAALIQLGLPGTAYICQGEELGLPEDLDLTPEQIQDPNWERSNHRFKGRDGCRIPLPWTNDPESFGFSQNSSSDKASRPWLPQPKWFKNYTVENENKSDDSSLSLYRRALSLRARLIGDIDHFDWDDELPASLGDSNSHDLLSWILPTGLRVVTNFSDTSSYPLSSLGTVVLASNWDEAQRGILAPNSTVWITE